jgi:hypothetical protein
LALVVCAAVLMNLGKWIFAWVLFMTSVAVVKGDEQEAPTITVPLRRGAFPTYAFVPSVPPKAIILFGSGDGGWGQIEIGCANSCNRTRSIP